MNAATQDTIVAQATPAGRGGVGVVRVSGPKAKQIACKILGQIPQPRQASYAKFTTDDNEVIDLGLALWFPAPGSFTGEDVVEFQGHGGQVVIDRLIETIIAHGARLAKPGEFSERAFLNDKIDLVQAEAIADLIDAANKQSAQMALRSLQGAFSDKITSLVEQLIELRLHVEAAIDFPEEEIDFLSDKNLLSKTENLQKAMSSLLASTQQGVLIKEGISMVLTGLPNAGKSSLLNQLTGQDSAIVTQIPGTTRDTLKETIDIDGLCVNITDTAGLRESADPVEKIGIERAKQALPTADFVVMIVDACDEHVPMESPLFQEIIEKIGTENQHRILIVKNKIDLNGQASRIERDSELSVIHLSALTGEGVPEFCQYLRELAGVRENTESEFLARRRHLDALQRAGNHINQGVQQLMQFKAGELMAEELRVAQDILGEITGKFSSDDLLGRIFSTFCIGK